MYLVIAGIAEVFYAASMLRTEGFTRIYPSIFCLTFIGVSMYFLSLATRTIPVGTAGNDSNLLIVFYVQIMPDDLVMQLHRF
ncbi:TPA: multidrug efflux SMR transporter [Klebsiella pneumoniae]